MNKKRIRTVHSNVSRADFGIVPFQPDPPIKAKPPAIDEAKDWSRIRKPLHLWEGCIFPMGSLQQKEITWRVLKIRDGKALVISEKGLEVKRFHETCKPVSWETCSLRKWLNEEFYISVFSEEDRSRLAISEETGDKVFIFDPREADIYFNADTERKAVPTTSAKQAGAACYYATGGCWWWLRPTTGRNTNIGCVDGNGQVKSNGYLVIRSGVCVRPVMWVSLE